MSGVHLFVLRMVAAWSELPVGAEVQYGPP